MGKKPAKAKKGRPPKPGGPDEVITIRLSLALLTQLDTESAAAGFTRSDAIHEACEEWLKRQARKKVV
jgi:metal-responsive CopG/Arc/MetJ family transcriptional regulator